MGPAPRNRGSPAAFRGLLGPVREILEGLPVMRLLFAAVGAYGHLHPVLPVALAAQAAGHEVTVATPAAFHPTVRQAGLDVVAAGMSNEQAFRMAVADPDGPPISRPELARLVFTRIIPERVLADLKPVLATGAWDLVAHEVWNFAVGVGARAAGIPAVTMTLGRIPDGPYWDRTYAAFAEFAAAPGVTVKKPRTFDQPYLDLCPPSFPAPRVSEFVETHILMRPRAWNPPCELPSVLFDRAPGRPLVYLTLGALGACARPGVLQKMIDGLGGIPADALVSTGPAAGADSLAALPANVTVAEWVPQADLMPHADVAVHHAGSGTMFAALANGVPQVLPPQGADQFDTAAWAAWAARTGSARQILPEEITPSRVADGIRALLGNEHAQQAARGLQREIEQMRHPKRASTG